MITLAFDSTAKVASVAVADGKHVLASYTIDNGLTQSELLLPMAEAMLKSLKISFSDIGLLACTVGPGSFTGVRIGAALVKGIGFGRNIPCVSISTLEALAENASGIKGIIAAVMDARRGQFYAAVFKSDADGILRLSPDEAISTEELYEKLKAQASDEPIYLVGDGYYAARASLEKMGLQLAYTPELLIMQNAASVAKLAAKKWENGESTDDCGILPTYLRVPQAERERLERLSKSE